MASRPDHHAIVVWGPAGSGKSTVAKRLADDLQYIYIEGDEYHSPEAVQKMSRNEPLTDADRWDWLIRLRERAAELVVGGGAAGVVLSCSALKKKYRDVLRILAVGQNHGVVDLRFVYLHVPADLLVQRVQARANHYMKAGMVLSQVDSLEPPTGGEHDTVTVEAGGDLLAVYRAVRDSVAAAGPGSGQPLQRQSQTARSI